MLKYLTCLITLHCVLSLGGCAVFFNSEYEGPKSDHFDGDKFFNQQAIEHAGFMKLMKWMFNREKGEWLTDLKTVNGEPPPAFVKTGDLRITFVNHATVLIQIDHLNILTDPIWSERCSPYSWIGPKRVRPPGIAFEQLPPIDAVVISHNHYDHFDVPTLVRLYRKFHPRIFVGLGNAATLKSEGVDSVEELDWWQKVEIGNNVTITFTPSQHFSSRGLTDRDRTLWGSYVISAPEGNVYFAGDTGLGPHFAQIQKKFQSFRVSLLPIGAFRPRWFMKSVHISPEEAVKAHRILNSALSIPIHYGTFQLGDDGQFESIERLLLAMDKDGFDKANFWILDFGEGEFIPAQKR